MLTTGEVVVTATIVSIMNSKVPFYDFVRRALQRHRSLDFGDLDTHDLKANQDALKYGSRVFSAYLLAVSVNCIYSKIYIITEADRSCTTILFPHEY